MKRPLRRRISPSLTSIDAQAMRKAICEFNEQGRPQFLKLYGFLRSSKFYLIFGQRLYDTKALVGAAYRHATGKALRHTEFSGGTQTQAVFRRLARQDSDFAEPFEDRLRELRNLRNEFDRIPHVRTDLRELGFSDWIPLGQYRDLKTGWLPGVYVIACANSQPGKMGIIDRRVVYIGETVSQTIRDRLAQLKGSIEGKRGHSGGERLCRKGYRCPKLWVSIRSFPLRYGLDDAFAKSFRSAQIRHLERTLLYEYVHTVHSYPDGNSK